MAEIFESTVDWKERYKELKKNHDLAYNCIDKGLSFENSNQTDLAVQKYDEGLQFIEKALTVPIDCPQNVDATWERAIKMVDQMRRTKKEILSRLSDIQSLRNTSVLTDVATSARDPNAPPSYDEAMASTSNIMQPLSSNSIEDMSSPNSTNTFNSSSISTPYQTRGSFCMLPNTFVPSTSPSDVKLVDDSIDSKARGDSKHPISLLRNSNASETPNKSNSEPKEITVEQLEKALQLAKLEIDRHNAIEIFSCNNVSLCYISPQGEISTSTQTDVLKMFVTEDTENPCYYLQVGRWRFPLVKGMSPCIRTRYGAFLFPDVESHVEGRTIGLIVPEDCIEPVAALLEDILSLEFEPGAHPGTQPPSDLPETISRNIISGGNYISNALIKGAEKVEQYVSYGTPRVIEKISPSAQNTELPSKFKTGIKVTKNVSESAAKTTGYIAGKVSSATVSFGKFLSPHVYRTGTALMTKYYGCKEEEASKTVDNIVTVASGAIQSIGAVYGGLEVAGAILGKSIADSTVKIVQHKYGQPVGEFTQDTFHTIGNCMEVNTNVRSLATKRLIKNTVKQTGKQFVLEQSNTKQGQSSKENLKTSKSTSDLKKKSMESKENEADGEKKEKKK